ncbi:hypothetical protein ACIBL3_00100 [Kribbella sp. NPDC050124]|uniref:hypothetical protein n=1 Tax=Kribbella sp. NPDC050124 TaxID=3364114 RepID=UPI0037A3A08C
MTEEELVLDGALLGLADVLAGVEVDVSDYCTFCYGEEDAVALSGPVGGIPEELVARAAFEGPDHWDDFANVYRKLTPRLMALMVYDELHLDEELVASRLVTAGCWSTWAESERTAMLAVCNLWWEATLASYPRTPEALKVLSFLATTPVPFTHWLEVWNAQPAGAADLHAADLCLWWAGDLLGGDLMVGWSGTIDITTDVKRWILEDAPPRLARVPADPRLAEYIEILRGS